MASNSRCSAFRKYVKCESMLLLKVLSSRVIVLVNRQAICYLDVIDTISHLNHSSYRAISLKKNGLNTVKSPVPNYIKIFYTLQHQRRDWHFDRVLETIDWLRLVYILNMTAHELEMVV